MIKELVIPQGANPESIPDGLCGCGCGAITRVSPRNHRRYGYEKGKHFRFLHGHAARVKPIRISYTEHPETGCWLWAGYLRKDGYANIRPRREQSWLAHRYVYFKLVGPVEEGMELNHLCGTRHCINPEHLEVTTHRGNVRHGRRTVLTPELVAEIRRRYAEAGGRYGTGRRLADEYGVAPTTISAVVTGKTWTDLAQTA